MQSIEEEPSPLARASTLREMASSFSEIGEKLVNNPANKLIATIIVFFRSKCFIFQNFLLYCINLVSLCATKI